jgi:hypothetical protein
MAKELRLFEVPEAKEITTSIEADRPRLDFSEAYSAVSRGRAPSQKTSQSAICLNDTWKRSGSIRSVGRPHLEASS